MGQQLTQEQILAIQFWRSIDKKEKEQWDGTLEQAKRQADEFTDVYGMKAFVIKIGGKYEWVTEKYFETYKYRRRFLWFFSRKGKIYYETNEEV